MNPLQVTSAKHSRHIPSFKRTLLVLLSASVLLTVAIGSGQGWLERVLSEKEELSFADPETVPVYGTFWSLQRTNWPPLPYNPFPDLPVSHLYGNSFLLWDLEVDYEAIYAQRRLQKARALLESQYGLSAMESAAVLESEAGIEWAMTLDGMSTLSLGTAYSYVPGTFYLRIGEVATNADLTLHGTSSQYLYSVLSAETLTNPQWITERVVQGTAGQDWTELALPVGNRTNDLFFRGKQWQETDSLTNGLTVALTDPMDGAYYPLWPTNVALEATASATNGTIVGVGFYAGSTLVGFDEQAPYQATWAAMRGNYELTVRAFDSAGGSLRSAPVSVSVDPCYPAVDVMLVVDRSTSMTNEPGKFANARSACTNFTETLQFPIDQAGLVSFSSAATTDQALTVIKQDVLNSIGEISISSGTRMSNAIYAARMQLTSSRRNTNALPVMVVLSDGQPSDAARAIAEANRAKTNDHIRIFTIGLGTNVTESLMKSIATTPDDYFYASDSSQLNGLFAAVAARLCRTGPEVEIVWPTNNSTFLYPQVFNLLARAGDEDGGVSWVRFCNNGQPIGMASPVSGTNLWSFTWNGAVLGTNLLTAVAMDNSELITTSAVHAVVLEHPAPTIQITAPTNGQLFTYSPTNILLSANPTASGGPVTNVQFLANGQPIGRDQSPPWQVLWIGTPAASNYTITAIATDYLGLTASHAIDITVNAMPQVTWQSPTNRQEFVELSPVPMHVTATDLDGSVAGVEMDLAGTTSTSFPIEFGSTNGFDWTLTFSNLTAGTYAATAVATDNRGAETASEVRVFSVKSTNEPPSVWITWPTNGGVFRAGADITMTAGTSNGVPGGVVTNVSFYCDERLLGHDPVEPYSLTECCWKPGTYILRAVAVDTLGNSGVSEGVEITVADAVPTRGEGFWDPVLPRDAWEHLSRGIDDYAAISAIQTEGTNVYLGIQYLPWSSSRPAIVKWDGNEFEPLFGLEDFRVNAMALSAGCLYVGGQSWSDPAANVYRWDGTNWAQMGASLMGSVNTVVVINGEVFIGGDFIPGQGSDTNLQYFARWNAGAQDWEAVAQRLNGPVWAIASFCGQLHVGGDFTGTDEGENLRHIAKLEGDQWIALANGVGGTNSYGVHPGNHEAEGGVFCLAPCGDKLFVGGDFTWAGEQRGANGLAIWQSNRWSGVNRGLAEWEYWPYEVETVSARVVRAIAVRGNDLFLAGRFRGPLMEGTKSLISYDVVKATWSEAEQDWSWSSMDGGLDEVVIDGPIGTGLALALLEGADASSYSVLVGGAFRFGGVTRTSPPEPLPWVYFGQCLGRWDVNLPRAESRPNVRITSPAPGQVFTNSPPEFAIDLLATASGTGNIVSVDFWINGKEFTKASYASNDVYSAAWGSPTNGLYALKATALSEDGLTSESGVALFVVKEASSQIIAAADIFILPEGSQTFELPVLANDLPQDSSLRIGQVVSSENNLGRIAVAHHARSLFYSPLPLRFGEDRFFYAITNSTGEADTAWVTVNILSKPRLAITQPYDGDRFGFSSEVTVSGYSRSYDWERPITNVTLLVNGNIFAQTTNTASFAFTWSNSVPGFYVLEAEATDAAGVSNRSPWVTIALTNGVAGQLPVAKIMNLPKAVATLSDVEFERPPVIREGLFNLEGLARDPDSTDVSYKVLLFRPQDHDETITDNFFDLIYITEPFADVTPAPKNYQGFHVGGDVGGELGGFFGDVAGDLGQLDLTAIPNGVYDMVLRVRGGTDETNAIVRVQIESNLKLGQFSFSEQDLVLPVNGIPLTVTRTYSSMNPRSGAFGHGWTFALNDMDVQLDEQRTDVTIGGPEAPMSYDDEESKSGGLPRVVSIRTGGGWNVTLTLPDGRRTTFAFKPRAASGQAYAEWVAPPGIRATLKAWPDSAKYINYYPWLSWADGGYNSTFATHDVPGWVLEIPDGTKYYITRGEARRVMWDDSPDRSGHFIPVVAYDPQPKLTRIEQRSGDVIEIGDNSIQHLANWTNLTRSVTFERDAAGRIRAIFDPVGTTSTSSPLPCVRYVYNRDTGNLIQVHRLQDREAGTYSVIKYHYDHPNFPHYITSIEDPRGIPLARTEYGEDGRIRAITDAEGNRTQTFRSFGSSNVMEMVVDPLNRTNITAFDLRGNAMAATNAVGGITLMSYDHLDNRTNEVVFLDGQPYATNRYAFDTNGWLLASVDALEHSNTFGYNDYGQVTNSIDARGFGTTNWFDERGNLLRTADALGHETTNAYSEAGLLIWSRDPVGTISENTFDENGNLVGASVTDASGILSTNTFALDENGNQTESVTWRRVDGVWVGATNSSVLDAQGRMLHSIDPLGHTNSVIYNSIGRQELTIDKLGRTNRFEYDWRGRLWRTIYSDQNTEVSYFDSNGNRTNSLDRASRSTGYVFDALGRVVQTVYANNATNRTVFDELGRVRFSVDARGVTNSFGYDRAGRRTSVTNALGTAEQQVYRYGFDENGNQVWALNPSKVGITNVFDALNRLVEVRYADQTRKLTGFDGAGRRVAETNEQNVVTLFGHDGLGRLLSVTNAFGTTNQTIIRYEWDEAGNQIAQIDALNRTNTCGYNLLGQRVWHELPGGQTEYFGYDPVGNTIRHTNFNGIVITNEYNEVNRLTNVSTINGIYVRTTHTPAGQRETMENNEASIAFTYDLRDRLVTKTVAWKSGKTITLNYSRDANGNVTNIWSSTPNGVDLAYDYDPLNRLKTVHANGQLAADYTFDLAGNLGGITLGNSVTNLCQHDVLNRLTNMVWKLNGTPLASFHYQLGPAGDRTNLAEIVNGTSWNYSWQYDSLYRLRQETITGFGSISYGLDAVGNRTNRQSIVGGLPDQNFSYTANDWLASDSYDADGNTIGSGGNTFGYDPFNRFTNFNDSVFFGYDGDGNRITKTADGVTTYFLIDDQNPTGYAQVLEEHRATGGPTNLSGVFNFGLALVSQRETSGTTYYFLSDGHASTRMLVNQAGAVVNAFTYDAFGNLVASNAPPQTAYLYCAEYFDPHTCLIYLRARLDNPQTGRFLTRDSWEGNIQIPLSLHNYLYAADDPVNNIDPSGHMVAGIAIDFGGRGFIGASGAAAINMAKAKVIAKLVIVTAAAAVTLTGDRITNSSNAMRLQLQEGENHYWSLPMFAPSNIGVTSSQVRAGLGAMHTAALTESMLLPFPYNLEPELYSSIIRLSQRITPVVEGGGVIQGGNVLREEFIGKGKVFRIDLENLRGHNLRR